MRKDLSDSSPSTVAGPVKPTARSGSLRERKKEKQRLELLQIGAELFRLHGYEQVRMDDIAQQAFVSTKTVYNYFPTKQQLLVELLNQDRLLQRASYEKLLNAPLKDPVETFARLLRADLGDVRSVEDKRLWRELLSAATRGHDKAEDEFDKNRKMFTDYIERLLRHYISIESISGDLNVADGTDLIYAVNAHVFREYCASESSKPEQALNHARHLLSIVLKGYMQR